MERRRGYDVDSMYMYIYRGERAARSRGTQSKCRIYRAEQMSSSREVINSRGAELKLLQI
jgi:hypothetical protein